jgi:hypothetical protein
MFYVASLAQFQRNGNLECISGQIIQPAKHFSFPIRVAARSNVYVCGRLAVEIVSSNPNGGMGVSLL